MPTAPPLKQDEILTFSQCSPKFMKLTEFIGITTRNMHVKFEAVRRSYNFWHKNAYSAGPLKQDEIYTFSQWFSKIHETYRIYWNHHQKHACEIWGGSEKLQFLMEKCRQRRTFKTGWNFDIFSMFSKIHETYRIYWNHHQKHECEIWGSSDQLQIFDMQMWILQRRTFKTGWSLHIFSMVLQNAWNLQKLLESLPETCMWNFEAVRRSLQCSPWKNAYSAGPSQTGWNLRFSQWPPEIHDMLQNLRQFGEVTNFWNMHVKIWGSLEKLHFLMENADSAGPLKQDEI